MPNNSLREEFEKKTWAGHPKFDEINHLLHVDGSGNLDPEKVFTWLESELSKARQQGREEVIEEVKFQTSILFPETEGARATAAHLIKNLRDHFTPKN